VSDWLEWQVVDSAFPTGLFAHSSGLESAWQHGEVERFADVQQFVEASILQAGHATLPFVNDAFADRARLEALDALAEAFLTNAVANRASRIQGRTLAATAARIWPEPGMRSLQVRANALHAHVAPLSGAVFRQLHLRLVTVQRIVLYSTARGVLSAAVRLGIIGSFEAQQLQTSCTPCLDRVAQACSDFSVTDLAQTAPVIDVLQSAHDRLYSRLFQS
jgi:urease accessory protein